jgi:hypothetical protein
LLFTPKALRPRAQRCAHQRATLGTRAKRRRNPIGVAALDYHDPRVAALARVNPGL